MLLSDFAWGAQKATVMAQESYVYRQPDFDAEIIATVKQGEVYEISNAPQGPFFRIRLKDRRLGWISSVDVKSGQVKGRPTKKKAGPLNSHVQEKRELGRFFRKRWQGPRVELLNWREKTLGRVREDQLTLIGWGWTGPRTFSEGPFYMDSAVTLAWDAPDYYERVTGQSSSGWILKLQTALLRPRPWGENLLLLYGVGPVLTFSHFETSLILNGRRVRYNLDDLTLGLAIPLGISYRWGTSAWTAWYRFYWEKQIQSSFSLGWGFEF
ncbi:MAG: SH3 domain-containing protein [Bdellovibrionales bacterium]